MFRGVDESAKKKALKDLETYTWVHLVGMSDDDEETDLGWSIIAFSPEFVSKLEESTGIDTQELPKLIAASANRFIFCLLRAIEIANDEEPLRLDSLREIFVALGVILDVITDKEITHRRSLVAGRAEQELPLFLQPVAHNLRTLLEDYVIEIIRDMELPALAVTTDLLSQCGSEAEKEKFLEYVKQIDRRADELFAAKDTTEDKIWDELTSLIDSFFDPEQ